MGVCGGEVRASLLLTLIQVACAVNHGVSWGYHGGNGLVPEEWAQHYKACMDSAQSPIDIQTYNAQYDPDLRGLTLVNWRKEPTSMTLTNNGHSATVAVQGDFRIRGAGLPGEFQVAQFHFHVGRNNKHGSEHTINSDHFPAEMHVVSWNMAHGSMAEAADRPDGLAVLGIMLQVGPYEDSDKKNAFSVLTRKLRTVVKPGSSTEVPVSFSLADLLPSSLYPLYRYQGSLTTPGCYESVTWTLSPSPVTVARAFLIALRELEDQQGAHLVDNYRPLQALNGRRVTTCC